MTGNVNIGVCVPGGSLGSRIEKCSFQLNWLSNRQGKCRPTRVEGRRWLSSRNQRLLSGRKPGKVGECSASERALSRHQWWISLFPDGVFGVRNFHLAISCSSVSAPYGWNSRWSAGADQVDNEHVNDGLSNEEGQFRDSRDTEYRRNKNAAEPRSLPDYLIVESIVAARLSRESNVLCLVGDLALINRLTPDCWKSLVVCYSSLEFLADLKDSNDDIICWHGDIFELPCSAYGPFDCVLLDTTLPGPPLQLFQTVSRFCKTGGRIIVFNDSRNESLAPHFNSARPCSDELLSLASLQNVITSPLQLQLINSWSDSPFWVAALEVSGRSPPAADDSDTSTLETEPAQEDEELNLVPGYPYRVRGQVVRGFGRGSKQMGLPTANVNPEDVQEEVLSLSKGVYYGWAQAWGGDLDKGVYKMVMNIGNRPTFADGGGITVEVHILHDYGDVDFYGETLNFVVLGFIRGEMQFKSPRELIERIHTDIDFARRALDGERMQVFAGDRIFSLKEF